MHAANSEVGEHLECNYAGGLGSPGEVGLLGLVTLEGAWEAIEQG